MVAGCEHLGPSVDATEHGVRLIALARISRLNLAQRAQRVRHLASLAREIQPRIVVLHSPELLLALPYLRRHTQAALWYDVHEDYALNFRFGSAYAAWPRAGLANAITQLEKWAAPRLDAATYAEVCFGNRLGIAEGRWATLPNAYQAPAGIVEPAIDTQDPLMLTTGTLAADWGLWESAELWIELNRTRPVHWVVVGQANNSKVLDELKQRVNAAGLSARFTLRGGSNHVPYAEVVGWIRRCTFGTALYRLNPSIQDRIPSKFYEYIAQRKPLVTHSSPAWDALERATDFALRPDKVAAALETSFSACYPQEVPSQLYAWSHYAPVLVGLSESLLK